jgi:hypothetical protein
VDAVGGVLLDPARLQPPAITTVTAMAATVLIESLTRFSVPVAADQPAR